MAAHSEKRGSHVDFGRSCLRLSSEEEIHFVISTWKRIVTNQVIPIASGAISEGSSEKRVASRVFSVFFRRGFFTGCCITSCITYIPRRPSSIGCSGSPTQQAAAKRTACGQVRRTCANGAASGHGWDGTPSNGSQPSPPRSLA